MAAKKNWFITGWDPASPQQEQALLELGKANSHSAAMCEADCLDWRYRRAPAGPAVVQFATEGPESDRVIGQYIAMPLELAAGGQKLTVGLSINALIDPEYRGLGLISALIRSIKQECAERGITHVLGYPNPNFHGVAVRFFGFKDIGEIPLLIRVLRLSSTARKRFPLERWRGIAGLLAAPGNFVFTPRGRRHEAVSRVEHFDGAYDELNECLKRRFPIMVSRHADYLNWRYPASPFEYSVLAVRDERGVQGYLAYRVMDFAGMRCGMIVDFIVRGDAASPRVGAMLLHNALLELHQAGCDIAGALCQRQWLEYTLLRRQWFLDCPMKLKPQPFTLIGQKTAAATETAADLFDVSQWLAAMGDYDAV